MTEPQPGPGRSEEDESFASDGLTPLPVPPDQGTSGGVLHPQLPDYKLRREQIRGMVAGLLLINLFITLLAPWLAVGFDWALADEVQDLTSVLLPAVVGLVGAATGFYFGANDKADFE